MSQKNTASGQSYQRETQYRKSITGIIREFERIAVCPKPRNNSIALLLIVRLSLVGLISARFKIGDFFKSPILKERRIMFPSA